MGFFTNLKDFFIKLVFLLLPFATLLPMVLSYLHDVVGLSLAWGFLLFIVSFFTAPLIILIYWIVRQRKRGAALLPDSPFTLNHVLWSTVIMLGITVLSFVFLYVDWVSDFYLFIAGLGFFVLVGWLISLPFRHWDIKFDKDNKEERTWKIKSMRFEYGICLALTALLLLFYLSKNGVALYEVDRISYNRAFYLEKNKPAAKVWKIIDDKELAHKRRFAQEDIRYAVYSRQGQTEEALKDSVYRSAVEHQSLADSALLPFANKKWRHKDPAYKLAVARKKSADSLVFTLDRARIVADSTNRMKIVHWIDHRDSTIKAEGDFFNQSRLSLADSSDFYFDSATIISFRNLLGSMQFDSKIQAEFFFNALRKEVAVLDNSVKRQYQQSWKDVLAGVQLRVVLLNGMMILLLAGLLYCLSFAKLASPTWINEKFNKPTVAYPDKDEQPAKNSTQHLVNDPTPKKEGEPSPTEKAADFIRNLIILHIAILICVLKVVKAENITGPDQFWMFRLQELIAPAEDEKRLADPRSDTSFYGLLRDTRNRVELIEQMAFQTATDVKTIKNQMDSLPDKPELDRQLNTVKNYTQDLIK